MNRCLIYNKVAESDPLRQRLARRGVGMICPHRKKRKNRQPKMAAFCVATRDDGRSNESFLGGPNSVSWSCVGSIMSKCIKPLSMSLVYGLLSDNYETAYSKSGDLTASTILSQVHWCQGDMQMQEVAVLAHGL